MKSADSYPGKENISDKTKLITNLTADKAESSNAEKVKLNGTQKRINVIILTHQSSGSTFLGNIFNFHPDVFYLFEALLHLKAEVYGHGREWSPLDKKALDAYRIDASNLLGDFFNCSFQQDRTVDILLPHWIRRAKDYLAWKSAKTKFNKESIRKDCNSRRITVTKIMQPRLTEEIGIRELQRACGAEPDHFDCLIIHLVRDPRAVISSLIGRKFFFRTGRERNLFTHENTPPEGRDLILKYAHLVCSTVEENLNYVNEQWLNWFKSRYMLVRYEDIPGDLLNTVQRVYNFTGLAMAESISKWIHEGKSPSGVTNEDPEWAISKKDVERTDHWRFRLETSLVSGIEEACWSVMYMMGYISINGSEHLQHDTSQNLWSEKMPFPLPH